MTNDRIRCEFCTRSFAKLDAHVAKDHPNVRKVVVTTDVPDFIAEANAKVTARLNALIARVAEARDEMVTALTNNPEYAIKWNAGTLVAAEFKADAAREVLSRAKDDDTTLQDAMKAVIDRVKDELLQDRFSGGSTSAFSNAIDDAKRSAASELVTFHSSGLSHLLMEFSFAKGDAARIHTHDDLPFGEHHHNVGDKPHTHRGVYAVLSE